MLILGLLGMYFDAALVFITNSSLLFRLAVAILVTPILNGLFNKHIQFFVYSFLSTRSNVELGK